MFQVILFFALLAGANETGKLHLEWKVQSQDDEPITSVAFSPDGGIIATGCGRFVGFLQEPRGGFAEIRNAKSGRIIQTLRDHGDGVCSLQFHPRKKELATFSFDGIVRLWRTDTWITTKKFDAGRPLTCGCYSHSGDLVCAGGIALVDEGRKGDIKRENQNTVFIWNTLDGKLRQTMRGHTDDVYAVAVSPDDSLLATGAFDGTVRIWEVATGKQLHLLRDPRPERDQRDIRVSVGFAVAFSRDGKQLVTSFGNFLPRSTGCVAVWDVQRESVIQELDNRGETILSAQWTSQHDRLVLGGHYGHLEVWQKRGDRFRGERLAEPGERINGVAVSSDGHSVAVGCTDGRLTVWSMPEALSK